MIRPLARHRVISLAPIVLLGLATVVGGWLNGVDMHGHVVDDFTSESVGAGGAAKITHGARTVTADPSTGAFTFPGIPRESRVKVEAPGYFQNSATPAEEEIRMTPNSFTIQVNEAGDPNKHIANAEIRNGTTLLDTTNEGGNKVLSPHPGKDAKLLICAAGYDMKEITAHGVLGTFELTPGTNECPPRPTPTPSPSPSPSPAPSDSTPSASPTPSPTASP
ncbi:MAG: hypothetical protein AABM32_02185 [Chloroflexota bacterium]